MASQNPGCQPCSAAGAQHVASAVTNRAVCEACQSPLHLAVANGKQILVCPVSPLEHHQPEGTGLLKRLFQESQTQAIARDVERSEAIGTAASELLQAVSGVRDRLKRAASDAGLKEIEFNPDSTSETQITYEEDEWGNSHPRIEFRLTARSEGIPWILTIRGAVVRTTPDSFHPALYAYFPLDLELSGDGPTRNATWQPMASDEGEARNNPVLRVEPEYAVDGARLASAITLLAKTRDV